MYWETGGGIRNSCNYRNTLVPIPRRTTCSPVSPFHFQHFPFRSEREREHWGGRRRIMIPQQWASPCGNQCTQKYAALMQIPCNSLSLSLLLYLSFYICRRSNSFIHFLVCFNWCIIEYIHIYVGRTRWKTLCVKFSYEDYVNRMFIMVWFWHHF